MASDHLLDRTCRLLKRCDLGTIDLARRSGLGYEWLRKFRGGFIDDPGVKRTQRLHDFLVLYQAAKGNKDSISTPPDSAPPDRHASAM